MNKDVLNKKYIEYVLDDEKISKESYEEALLKAENCSAIYKGKPIPFLYMPKIFSKEDVEAFKEIMDTMLSILHKVIREYGKSEKLRMEFDFSEELERLILKEHGYKTLIPMGRFDIFYYNKDEFKFCELNADGSSAMNEDRELGRIISETHAFNAIEKHCKLRSFELFDSWVEEVENIYSEYKHRVENPTVAIVDFIDKGTSNEFKIFKERFENKGFKTFIVDPRELKYINEKLMYNDEEINIIYRRLVTRDLMERYNEIKDFVKAVENESVCLIGPIKTQVIHNKIIFKVLHDEEYHYLFNEDEIEFIKKHVPYTVKLNEVSDIEYFVHNKDEYLLKPCDFYASLGVYAGSDFTEGEWREKIEEAMRSEYLLQEYYNPPTSDLPVLVDDKWEVQSFRNITGVYMYNEKVKGIYSRVGREAIISGLHDYFTLPNFCME